MRETELIGAGYTDGLYDKQPEDDVDVSMGKWYGQSFIVLLSNLSMWNYRTIVVVGLVTQGLGSIPWSKLEVGIRSLLRESL